MTVASFAAVDRGIPRRLSTRPADRFYDGELVSRLSDKISVFLDGVELPEVASWDVDAGEITRRVRRKNGTFILDEDGMPTFQIMRGQVEVRWSKGSAA